MRIERPTTSNSVRVYESDMYICIYSSNRMFSPATRMLDIPYE